MNVTRTAMVGLVAAVLSVPAFGAGGADRAAGPASTLSLGYDLYMTGIPLGRVDVSARIQGTGYTAQSTLDTKGLISIFWQAHIEATSNGQLGPGAVRPAVYEAQSQHRSKHQRVTVTYGPMGPVNVAAEPPYNNKYPVTEEQRRNTVDPLSAMIHVATGIAASAQNLCGTVTPVYDGRRRYNIELVYIRTTNVKVEKIYSGPVYECQVKYVQIAGFKQKIVAEGKRLPRMFAWIVTMPGRTDPSRKFLVPVKLWAETDWGTAKAVASRIHLDGTSVGGSS